MRLIDRAWVILWLGFVPQFLQWPLARVIWGPEDLHQAWHEFGLWRVQIAFAFTILFALLAWRRPWQYVLACLIAVIQSALDGACGIWWLIYPSRPEAGKTICETLTGSTQFRSATLAGSLWLAFIILEAIRRERQSK